MAIDRSVTAKLSLDAKAVLQQLKRIEIERGKSAKLSGKIAQHAEHQIRAARIQEKLDKARVGSLLAQQRAEARINTIRKSALRSQQKGLYFTEKMVTAMRSVLKTQLLYGAGILAGALSFRMLARGISSSIKASITQEKAIVGMETAMRSMGRYSPEASARLQELAASLQMVSTFGDEATLEGIKFLVTFEKITDELLPRSIRAMADLSALTGKSLVQSANLLGKSSIGLVGELSRVGLVVDRVTYETEGYLGVLKQIETQVKGQAVAMRIAEGSWSAMKNTVGDAQEIFGTFLNLAIEPYLADLTRGVGNLNRSMATLRDRIKEVRRVELDFMIKQIQKQLKKGKIIIDMGGIGADIEIEGITDKARKDLEEKLKQLQDVRKFLITPPTKPRPTEDKADADAQKERIKREETYAKFKQSATQKELEAADELESVYSAQLSTVDSLTNYWQDFYAQKFALDAKDVENQKAKNKAIADAQKKSARQEIQVRGQTLYEAQNILDRYTEYTKASEDTRLQAGLNAGQAYLQGTASLFYQMSELNSKWFKYYQATAIAETIIATAQGVMQAYAQAGPWLGTVFSALITALGATKIALIAKQEPPNYSYAQGGVTYGEIVRMDTERAQSASYASGGVTSGAATALVGDNASGVELVIPSENIERDHVKGHTRRRGEDNINVINLVTQEDIAAAMNTKIGGAVVINHIGQDLNARKSTYRKVRETNRRR